MTCRLTAEPEFSKEQLAAYAKLMQKENISAQDLAADVIVQRCMQQGGFKQIDDYIAADKNLSKIVQKCTITHKLHDIRQQISATSAPDLPTAQSIRNLRERETDKAPVAVRQTTLDILTAKKKIAQNQG